jgi:hypothetical protein
LSLPEGFALLDEFWLELSFAWPESPPFAPPCADAPTADGPSSESPINAVAANQPNQRMG